MPCPSPDETSAVRGTSRARPLSTIDTVAKPAATRKKGT